MKQIDRASGLPLDIADIGAADLHTLKPALETLIKKMNDWAQLNYYKEANEALARLKNNGDRVIFFGDSITEFWLKPENGSFFTNPTYINRGISYQTTPQLLLRLRPDVIDLKPKAVVFLAGTNDIAGNTGPMSMAQTEANFSSIAELLSAHHIKLIFASLLPTSDYHYKSNDPQILMPQTERRPLEKIKKLNAWIKTYCATHNHIYLDYFSAMIDEQGKLNAAYSTDDLHPNKSGYAVMAPLAQAAIAKVIST